MVRPSILITDDDSAFRETLRSMLEPIGCNFTMAGDGEEALEILSKQDVHLMLLDFHMPRLTGIETIRKVRQFKAQLPCILLSAGLTEKITTQARLLNTYSVLAKPVTREILSITVEQALQSSYGWPQRTIELK
jgi:CheY-like chemotaxis protein